MHLPVGRVTPAGTVTEFAATCNSCVLSDLAQGSAGILYITSNDPTIQRFDTATGTFLAPIAMPNDNALGGRLAVPGDDIWITDFNNDKVWRYGISTGSFAAVDVTDPSDVAVDAAGNAWFTEPGDVNAPGSSNIGRIDAVSGAVTRTTTTVAPRGIAVASDGQVWFTARFTPQAVGRLDPATRQVAALFLLTDVGPEGIAAAPDGSVWFTQSTAGDVARVTADGTFTQGKTVKGSETVRTCRAVDPLRATRGARCCQEARSPNSRLRSRRLWW